MPGIRLPSTEDLSVTYRTSYGSVHNALTSLVKEGLVERLHGSGTYVAQSKTSEITCYGLYYVGNLWANEDATFTRSVHNALVEKLGNLKKSTRIFIDTRPASEHPEVLPALREAVNNREIQGLIAPIVNQWVFPALNKLPLPSAFIAADPIPNRISLEMRGFWLESVRRLAAQGCRSVGLIIPNLTPSFCDGLREALELTKMVTRDDWVRRPAQFTPKLAEYGYLEFQKLWALPEKPDGLIVWPDSIARGVITAVLEAGVRVPEQIKFVIHRNAHFDLLCPFPATFGISDEGAMADGLIQLVERQFRGEKVSEILIPYSFEETTAATD